MAINVQRLTAEEFDALALRPENRDKLLEFVGGEVVEVVSNPYSSKIAALAASALVVYLSQNDIGHVTGADGGYIVAGERYIPDVAFISYRKQPQLEYFEGYNPNPPDLAVEVLSPGNTDEEITIKIANYMAAGTVVWRIRPVEEQVAVFTPGQPVKILTIDEDIDGSAVLPGFTLPVKQLFPRREASESASK